MRSKSFGLIPCINRPHTFINSIKSLFCFYLPPRKSGKTGPELFWTTQRLLCGIILLAWGKGSQPFGERFPLVRQALGGSQHVANSYQGMIKAWKKAGLSPLLQAARQLRQYMSGIKKRGLLIDGFEVLAADGSRFALPRSKRNHRAFGDCDRGDGDVVKGPQLWVTMLWHVELALPWDWRIGRSDASERKHLLAMLKDTVSGCLLVMDGGFCGYELLERIMAGGRHFLVRVGGNVKLLTKLGYRYERHRGDIVYLWPWERQGKGQKPLVLRLIKVFDRKKNCVMYLLTDILDSGGLTQNGAERIYRLRWGVELAYRTLKQTFENRKLRSQAPRQVRLEMHALLLGLTLMGLWARGPIQRLSGNTGGNGGSEGGVDPRRWSPAKVQRLAMTGLYQPHKPRPWEMLLSQAVIDDGKKTPRGQNLHRNKNKTRGSWPRKKCHKPPKGKPKMRKASDSQRQKAAKFPNMLQ